MSAGETILKTPSIRDRSDWVTSDKTIVVDEPVEQSLLDTAPDPIVGLPVNRIEGPLKVAGEAHYAAEHRFPGLVHGVLVQAPFAFGRVRSLDISAAEAMPGVLAIIDDDKLSRQAGEFGGSEAPVQGLKDVVYFRQPVAVAVADTFERARAAAQAVRVDFEEREGAFDFHQSLGSAKPPESDLHGAFVIHSEQGDITKAIAGRRRVLTKSGQHQVRATLRWNPTRQ